MAGPAASAGAQRDPDTLAGALRFHGEWEYGQKKLKYQIRAIDDGSLAYYQCRSDGVTVTGVLLPSTHAGCPRLPAKAKQFADAAASAAVGAGAAKWWGGALAGHQTHEHTLWLRYEAPRADVVGGGAAAVAAAKAKARIHSVCLMRAKRAKSGAEELLTVSAARVRGVAEQLALLEGMAPGVDAELLAAQLDGAGGDLATAQEQVSKMTDGDATAAKRRRSGAGPADGAGPAGEAVAGCAAEGERWAALPAEGRLGALTARELDAVLRQAEAYTGVVRRARDELRQCKVCMEQPAEVVILPCTHQCLCLGCSGRVTDLCPICRGPIHNRFQPIAS